MESFERRPLGAFASSFYVFACVFFSVGRNARSFIIIAAFLLFLVAVIRRDRLFRRGVRRAMMALSAGMLAAALFAGGVVDIKLARLESESLENVEITGVVQSVAYTSPYSGCYTVKPYNEITSAGEVKLLLYCDDGELSVGDEIRCTADVNPIERTDDYRYSLYADGVVLAADAVGEVELLGKSDDLETRFSMRRDELSSRFTSEMSEKGGGFGAALLLGDRSELHHSVQRDFRSLGISHILALSGTHLTVLFALIGKLLPSRGKMRFARFFVMIFGVLFFMALTGFSASVVRSGIMFITAAAADLINRDTDSFTSLSAAVLIICIVNPYAPFDIGLQLSYASVIGLIISGRIGKRAAETGNIPSKILRRVIPAFVVPSVILPLSWLRFGAVSLVSPLANLVFVPVITFLIPVLAVLLLLSFVPAVFAPVAGAVDTVISFLLDSAEAVAGYADFMLPLKGEGTAVFVILLAVSLFGVAVARARYRKILGCVSVVFLSLTILWSQLYYVWQNRGVTAYYASAGTDDAVCVVSEGYTVLVDVGRYPSAARSATEIGVGSGGVIDALVLTHLHHNHRMTVSELSGNLYLKSLWLPVPYSEESESIFYGLCDEVENMGIPVYSYIPGEMLVLGECAFSSPSVERVKDSAHPAVSFALECDEGKLIYVGSRGNVTDVPDNCVRIIGGHGHEATGAVSADAAVTVISPECAGQLDAVSDSVILAEKAIIRFGDSPTVTAVTE